MPKSEKVPPEQKLTTGSAVVAVQLPRQSLGDVLQSTMGNTALGALLRRGPGPGGLPATALRQPATEPALPRFSRDPIHVDPAGVARPQPELPFFSRDPIHVDPAGVARPQPELPFFSNDPIHIDGKGVAQPAPELPQFHGSTIHVDPAGRVKPQPPLLPLPALPTVTGEPIFLDPAGATHTRRDVERDRARLNATLDTALSGLFARRRTLLGRGVSLKLKGVKATVATDQHTVPPTGSTIDLINATQLAVAESAWLDTRIADLRQAEWNVDFATPLTELTNENWRGLKLDWITLKGDLAAVNAAVSVAAAVPADFAERVARLTTAYLKYITYPRLKILYGDRIAGTGLLDGKPGDAVIRNLRTAHPDVFLRDDPGLYRKAYEDVKLLKREGLVPLAQLNSRWGGTTATQRYIPKADLVHTDPAGQDWDYHLSADFTDVPKAPAWRRIRTVHVTFRTAGSGHEPRYWWNVVKGDLMANGQSGNGHQPWMPGTAKGLVTDHAKDVDCRPPE